MVGSAGEREGRMTITPEHAELLENVLYMVIGGFGGGLVGFLLAAVLGAGASTDREQAAFRAGVEYQKAAVGRALGVIQMPRRRPAADEPAYDYLRTIL